jgi:hypothetical protein
VRRSRNVIGAVLAVLLAAACGRGEAATSDSNNPKPSSSASLDRVLGLDGSAAASKVFTAHQLVPALLPSRGGDPGTFGGLGSGMPPKKGELMDDCPAGAKGLVAELYRIAVPRVVRFTESDGSGQTPGPREALAPMTHDQAVRYFALQQALASACPQTSVSAVGYRSIPPQTVRTNLKKVQVGDEAFIQASTTWNGDATSSVKASTGKRAYAIFVRMGSVVFIFGEFSTAEAALAGGKTAAAHARPILLNAART